MWKVALVAALLLAAPVSAGPDDDDESASSCVNHPDGLWGEIGCRAGKGVQGACETVFGNNCRLLNIS